jgi:hypothetical protein
MKYDEVVIFGCSWAWGDELLNPELTIDKDDVNYVIAHTPYREATQFAGVIAKHLDAKITNYGINGGSNVSSQWEFLRWLDKQYDSTKKYLVINSITEADRTTWYNTTNSVDQYKHSVCVIGNFDDSDPHAEKWNQFSKHHLVFSSHRELKKLTYMQTIELFHGACQTRNIDLIQVNVWPLLDTLNYHPESLVMPKQGLRDLLTDTKLLAPRLHPNAQGHEYIANLLIPEIKRLYDTK